MTLQPTARSTLVSLVEEHVTGLIREASHVKRHAKRARINQSSSSSASDEGVVRRRLHAEDINLALQWRGSEKLYATGTIIPHGADEDPTNKKIDLEDYLKSEMEMRPPQEVGLTVHWLAVDGTQPLSSQNAVVAQNPTQGTGSSSNSSSGASASRRGINNFVAENETENDAANKSGVRVNQLLPRLLSEELQLYFTRVTLALERGGATETNRQQQDSVLASMARDTGLQELVPFLVNYVSQSLYHHVGNPDHCRTLVRMAHSLLSNPNLHLELHLHQLLPALLTCIVARRLSTYTWQNHWALRSEAAATLVRACNLFGDEYSTLKARVLQTLCDACSSDRALSTQYGSIVAISLFGSKAIDAFLLPLAVTYWNRWEQELSQTPDIQVREELQKCQQAFIGSLGIFLSQADISKQSIRLEWAELEGTFGDRLVMLNQSANDYTCCCV